MKQKKVTQKRFILDIMLKKGYITTLEAFKHGILSLRGRLAELERDGVIIERTREDIKTRWGKSYYLKYSVIKRQRKLKFINIK